MIWFRSLSFFGRLRPIHTTWGVSLYKITVYFEAVVHESTILLFPSRAPALPTLVQYHRTILGQYTTPLPTHVCMLYTIQYW